MDFEEAPDSHPLDGFHPTGGARLIIGLMMALIPIGLIACLVFAIQYVNRAHAGYESVARHKGDSIEMVELKNDEMEMKHQEFPVYPLRADINIRIDGATRDLRMVTSVSTLT